MDSVIQMLLNYGVIGLIIAAFAESVLSPIPPDFLLVTLALAVPSKAIYYSLAASGASIIGGFFGYAFGRKYGSQALNRFISPKYKDNITQLVERYGVWAIFFGALSPIPYKFICITAGSLRIQPSVFLAASVFGRVKRFMLEGILIYYYGPQALGFAQTLSLHAGSIIATTVTLAVISIVYWKFRTRRMTPSPQ